MCACVCVRECVRVSCVFGNVLKLNDALVVGCDVTSVKILFLKVFGFEVETQVESGRIDKN
jgi:hypothetical protein